MFKCECNNGSVEMEASGNVIILQADILTTIRVLFEKICETDSFLGLAFAKGIRDAIDENIPFLSDERFEELMSEVKNIESE